VLSPNLLEDLLSKEQKQLHSRVLSKPLDLDIIPSWKKRNGYPKPHDPAKTTPEEDEKRLQFFMTAAREDAFAPTRFFAPLEESIDWKIIVLQKTPDDQQAFEWGVRSLALAAEKTHCLGLDVDKGKDRRLAKARNLYWVEIANDDGRPAMDKLRLTTDFGCGQRQTLSRQRANDDESAAEPLERDMDDYNEDACQPISTPHHVNLTAKSPSTNQGPKAKKRRRADSQLTEEELAVREYNRKKRKNRTEMAVFDVGKILKLD
jgi:hypothetical protein